MKYVLRTMPDVDVEEAAEKVRQYAEAETSTHSMGDYSFNVVIADLTQVQLQELVACGLFASVGLEDPTAYIAGGPE